MRCNAPFVVRILTAAGIAVLAAGSSVRAETYYVATTGNDAAAGTELEPLRTVQAGVNKAGNPGDTVFVKQGLYRERVTFPYDGATGNPITLTGEDGVIIDGGTVVTGWQRVAGPGNVYRAPYTGEAPVNLTWNNFYILRIIDSLMPTSGMTILQQGPLGHTKSGDPQTRGWDGIEVMWGTLNGYIYVGFHDAAVDATDTVNNVFTTTLHGRHGGDAILIDGRKFITVRGLTARNAHYGIAVRNAAADCIIENNTAIGGKWSIAVFDGPSRILVRNNEITLGFIHTLDPNDPLHWRIWDAFKLNSDFDRVCIELSNVGSDNEVCNNHCYEGFDGIENSGPGTGHNVHHNLVEIVADDGLETDGDETNARWHDNFVRMANIAYRHKDIVGTGPMYVYRNLFYSRPGTTYTSGYGIYFFAGITPTCYIYQNTFVTSIGMCMGGTNIPAGLANTWVVNNIFSCQQIFKDNPGWTSSRPSVVYNYFGGDLSAPLAWWGIGNKVVKNGQLWSQATVPDFLLTSTSAAREMGIDLSQTWTISGTPHPALAGMLPGYFSGAQPDDGAVQFGEALQQYGPDVPNPPPGPGVPNFPPTASAGSDVTDGAPPLTVNFTGSGTDTDGTIVSYSWDFGDGIGTSTEQNPSYVYDLVGAYTATLTVTDNDGATGQATVDITVSGNRRPTALASADVTSGEAPLEVSFTGEGTDEDGTVVSYHWTFGDGSSSDEQNPSHTFAKAGDYTVTLTVTDNDGGFGQDRLIIHVTAALGADAVVDNKDTSAGKAFRTISGNWTISSAGTSIWNPADPAPSFRRQSVQTGAENARAEWTCKSLPAGEYEVFAWWPNVAYIPGANVAYEVYHAAGMTSVRVNQGLNGGTWVSLGKYSFAPGAHKVQIHNGQSGPGQYIAADAVRFVRTGVAKVAAVDNKDNGGGKGFQVVSGKWSSGSGTNIWDPADPKASYVRTAAQAGAETARAAWMCSYLPAGQYEVFAWWPKSTGMGQSVAYVVWHAAGTTTVRVNQSVGGGTWVSLGTYNVAAGAHKVQIHNGQSAPGSFVAADAVKFVKQ